MLLRSSQSRKARGAIGNHSHSQQWCYRRVLSCIKYKPPSLSSALTISKMHIPPVYCQTVLSWLLSSSSSQSVIIIRNVTMGMFVLVRGEGERTFCCLESSKESNPSCSQIEFVSPTQPYDQLRSHSPTTAKTRMTFPCCTWQHCTVHLLSQRAYNQ